jgi:hypothetical protein
MINKHTDGSLLLGAYGWSGGEMSVEEQTKMEVKK